MAVIDRITAEVVESSLVGWGDRTITRRIVAKGKKKRRQARRSNRKQRIILLQKNKSVSHVFGYRKFCNADTFK